MNTKGMGTATVILVAMLILSLALINSINQAENSQRIAGHAYSKILSSSSQAQFATQSQDPPYDIFGYNRLVYVFKDRFNNTIVAPIDADIANTTTINLTITPVVSTTNPNQTLLNINGIAGYHTNLGASFVPLENAHIYIYYNVNLNYVNYSVPGQTLKTILCSFFPGNDSSPKDCVYSNPVFPEFQRNADITTFFPDGVGGCAPPPPSLLEPIKYACNVFGYYQLPQTCGSRYCRPDFVNGTGECTTQLGLMGIVTTNASGYFSFTKTTCGIGFARISAQFYGIPAPEPVNVSQTLLPSSADPVTCPGDSRCSETSVLNFSWAPFNVTETTPIGLFELSYGSVGILVIVISLVSVLMVLLLKRIKRGKVFK